MTLVPDAATRFVAHWEAGGKPVLTASNALDGVWTIGFGHTAGVGPGDRITEAQAWALLREDLRSTAEAVDRLVTRKRPLSDNARAALISLGYNIGIGALGSSTVLRLVNKRKPLFKAWRRRKIRKAFLMWNKAPNGPGGALVVMEGLTRRRRAEARLFFR